MKVHSCDQCGRVIKDTDIRVSIDGFSVIHNINNPKMPKGFSLQKPEDFCSFQCLANWALDTQKLLDQYKEIAKKI